MESPAANEGDNLAVESRHASALAEPQWTRLLAAAIRDVDVLWRELDLPAAALPAARAAAKLFPLLVPRGFMALMQRGDLNDPLLRQVVPLAAELEQHADCSPDPLAESGCADTPGLLHKYHGRVLLVTTGACAVHCRYCFRRHFPYGELPRGRRWWSDAVAHISADTSISEVLLSGGDPLTLPDAQLAELAAELAAIPHLVRLRIHSRLPVVLPERVDERFLAWFTRGRLRPVLVIHANHPREITPAVAAACQRLRAAGVTVLNQSVLLAGVNDRVEILVELCEKIFTEAGVLPYYLHALDRVQGAAHFATADAVAIVLVREMTARLPGYLVPRLVREIPGQPNKVSIV